MLHDTTFGVEFRDVIDGPGPRRNFTWTLAEMPELFNVVLPCLSLDLVDDREHAVGELH